MPDCAIFKQPALWCKSNVPVITSMSDAMTYLSAGTYEWSRAAQREDDRLLDSGCDHVVSRCIGRDDVVPQADRQDVLAVVLLSADAHVGHDYARFPSLQGIDHVHAAELLEDAVVLLMSEAMQERTEVRLPGHLAGCELGGADRAEHLADRAADELLAAGGSEIRATISLKGPGQPEP